MIQLFSNCSRLGRSGLYLMLDLRPHPGLQFGCKGSMTKPARPTRIKNMVTWLSWIHRAIRGCRMRVMNSNIISRKRVPKKSMVRLLIFLRPRTRRRIKKPTIKSPMPAWVTASSCYFLFSSAWCCIYSLCFCSLKSMLAIFSILPFLNAESFV